MLQISITILFMDNYIKKILYLGPEGSNSQLAAGIFENKLEINTKMTPVSTITKAIEILDEENEDVAAVLPIENSIEGIVRETIDNFLFCIRKNHILYFLFQGRPNSGYITFPFLFRQIFRLKQ